MKSNTADHTFSLGKSVDRSGVFNTEPTLQGENPAERNTPNRNVSPIDDDSPVHSPPRKRQRRHYSNPFLDLEAMVDADEEEEDDEEDEDENAFIDRGKSTYVVFFCYF